MSLENRGEKIDKKLSLWSQARADLGSNFKAWTGVWLVAKERLAATRT